MNYFKLLLIPSSILFAQSAYCQLPETDIFLFEIKKTNNLLSVHNGINITKRTGYDNQPYFLPDNKNLIYVSVHEDNQADIYKYDIKEKKIIQVSNTTQSEYSPILTPDGKNISVVAVEKDSTQRIWQLNMDGSGSALITEKEDSIGYYSWLNRDSLLFFKTGMPTSLHVYCFSTQKDIWLADNITRSFKSIDNHSFFYVVKNKDKNMVRIYDTRTKKSSEYAESIPENEDFIWDKQLGLIKSEGSKLLRFNPETKTWLELADFKKDGLNKITRFAISPNGKYLVLVDTK